MLKIFRKITLDIVDDNRQMTLDMGNRTKKHCIKFGEVFSEKTENCSVNIFEKKIFGKKKQIAKYGDYDSFYYSNKQLDEMESIELERYEDDFVDSSVPWLKER